MLNVKNVNDVGVVFGIFRENSQLAVDYEEDASVFKKFSNNLIA